MYAGKIRKMYTVKSSDHSEAEILSSLPRKNVRIQNIIDTKLKQNGLSASATAYEEAKLIANLCYRSFRRGFTTFSFS